MIQELVNESLSTKINEYFKVEEKRKKIIEGNNNLLKYQSINFKSKECNNLIAKKVPVKKGKGFCYKKLLDDKVPSDKPGVYIFEIKSGDKDQVLKSFEEWVKAVNNDKVNKIKHVKPNNNGPSSIIYVGKKETNIPARFAQHLGFGLEVSGLKLNQWASELELELIFHVFYFDSREMEFLVGPLEKALQDSLKPMIGK